MSHAKSTQRNKYFIVKAFPLSTFHYTVLILVTICDLSNKALNSTNLECIIFMSNVRLQTQHLCTWSLISHWIQWHTSQPVTNAIITQSSLIDLHRPWRRSLYCMLLSITSSTKLEVMRSAQFVCHSFVLLFVSRITTKVISRFP